MKFILSHSVKLDEKALLMNDLEYDKNYSAVVQSNQFQLLIKSICGLISVPEIVMKVIILRALKEWLFKNNKTIETIHSMPINLKLNMMKQIFNIGKEMLKLMVTAPKEKHEVIIDIAFERAFKFYLNYYDQI